MIKPDVIVCQPDCVDFPYWRQSMIRNKDFFRKIFVVISRTYNRVNITDFLHSALLEMGAEVVISPPPDGTKDWRNVAVNMCLPLVNSERVLFLEQDFNFNNESFLPTVLGSSEKVIGFKEGHVKTNRLHPAFLLAETALVKKTSCNFGVVKDVFDHFGLFSQELETLEAGVTLEEMGLTSPNDWEHLAGLTSNYSLVMFDGKPNHNVARFIKYNQDCLSLSVKQSPIFYQYIARAAAMEVV